MSEKRRGLGRGLGALIPSGPASAAETTTADSGTTTVKTESPEQRQGRARTGTSKNSAASDAASSKPRTEQESVKATSETPPTNKKNEQEGAQQPARGRSVESAGKKNKTAGDTTGATPKRSGDNAPAQTKETAAEVTGKKPSVSRETSPESRGVSKGTKPSARSRRDMGQALRSTTSVRRPVDMFFLPSDEPEGNDESEPSTSPVNGPPSHELNESPGNKVQHDVSRETSDTPRTTIAQGRDGTTAEDPPAKNTKSFDAASAPNESRNARGAVSRQSSLPQQAPNGRTDSSRAADSDPNVSRETSANFEDDTDPSQLGAVPGAQFAEIPVADIHPNRKQPRQVFDEDELAELAFSVKELGVLQPVVVRPSREGEGAKYELVMGERRWRAVQKAGLDSVPAIIRETADDDLLRDALLENLHRSQLNPLEEAAAYQQLLEEFGATQDELSRRIGRSRPQISNTLRLLRLPPLVQRRVAAGVLSSGHARALLGLTDPADMERLAQRVVAEGMSVRATEETVALSDGLKRHGTKRKSATHRHDDRLNYIADAFSDRLDTSVKIQLGARKGKMTIEFASVEDLNRIIDVLDPKMEDQS